MAEKVYHDLCEVLSKRGGTYPGKDIPEFYTLVEELFTPEEAAVYNAIPKGFHPAETIAKEMGKEVNEVKSILEGMANKGFALPVPWAERPFTVRRFLCPGSSNFNS